MIVHIFSIPYLLQMLKCAEQYHARCFTLYFRTNHLNIFFCCPLLAFDNACSNLIFVFIALNILIKIAAARAYVPTAAKSLSATPYGIMRHTEQLTINLINLNLNHESFVLWCLTSKTGAKVQIKFVTCNICKKFNFVSECFLFIFLAW